MRLGIVLLSLAAATIGPALVAAAPTAGSSPALPNSEAGLDNPSCGARSLTALEEGGEGGAEEKFDDSEEKNKCRAAAVVEAFRHSWAGYKKYAWGADELLPVSNKPGNSRNGWGATIVDALSTAAIMELEDVVHDCLRHLAEVDFTTSATDDFVSLFETTIRYLGGLLSGYDLLKGPYAHLVNKDDQGLVSQLLVQAETLAESLAFAFDTPSGLPANKLNLATKSSPDSTTGVAVAGTLVLEWTRLSDLTGNPRWAKLAQQGESHLLKPEPASLGEPFPGLLGRELDLTTGDFLSTAGGWSSGSDSFYEYLLKMWLYSPTRFSAYRDRWLAAVDSTVTHLLQPVAHEPSAAFVAEYINKTLVLAEGHLTCFAGGSLALGGAVLGRSAILTAGLQLTAGCAYAYEATPAQIAPERWAWDKASVPAEQASFFASTGFYTTDASYNLRPEAIESFYHGHVLTGDSKYRQWAWNAFTAINATARTSSGFSSFANVMVEDGGIKKDVQESFWFAETLKYSYLIFAPPGPVGIGPNSPWVFNTEAHPLSVAA